MSLKSFAKEDWEEIAGGGGPLSGSGARCYTQELRNQVSPVLN